MAFEKTHGLLLIADISGYTRFLSETALVHAQFIVADLLEAIVDADGLALELSKFEGDAVLFYKREAPFSYFQLQGQLQAFFDAFHQRRQTLASEMTCPCSACRGVADLTLKFVGHAGEFGVHRIRSRVELIGREVIVVHRLLKNQVKGTAYALLSRALLDTCEAMWPGPWHVETYEHLGEVEAAVFDLNAWRDEVADRVPGEKEIG